MNKRVIAAKMKFNMYLLSAALGVIAAVALVLLLVLRYGRAGALLAVVIAVIMAFPVVWYLVRGIRGLRLPKELIVCENGTLTVHTFRGRREIPLREVREMRVATRKGVELLIVRKGIYEGHSVDVAFAGEVVTVDMVEDSQAAIRLFGEVRAEEGRANK